MANESWKSFYEENLPPADFTEVQAQIFDFCNYHASKGMPVALITSGGTTVPLEHNTVRFVDNFSAGTRGSASAEYFLKSGVAVIFLYRTKSLEPYLRHIPTSELLESFVMYKKDDGNSDLKVEGEITKTLIPVIEAYKHVVKENMLLKLQFTTLASYLHLLYEVAQAMKSLGKSAIFYLAAAVSDFYIPHKEMSTHKIHSDEALSLSLQLVPKMLNPLVRYWVPEAYVVSFKLETDENILIAKARGALEKYGHKLVIGNELHSRKYRVIFVTPQNEKEVVLSKEDMKKGKEIEELIIQELLKYYSSFKVE